jgi:hypothetical protein
MNSPLGTTKPTKDTNQPFVRFVKFVVAGHRREAAP